MGTALAEIQMQQGIYIKTVVYVNNNRYNWGHPYLIMLVCPTENGSRMKNANWAFWRFFLLQESLRRG